MVVINNRHLKSIALSLFYINVVWFSSNLKVAPLKAQTIPPNRVPNSDIPDRPLEPIPPSPRPLTQQTSLCPTHLTSSTPQQMPNGAPQEITVKNFEFHGNTAISNKDLDTETKPYTNHPISFSDLLKARNAVEQLYCKKNYIGTIAYIPSDQPSVDINNGKVIIKVIEGSLEDIRVTGTHLLDPAFVRNRIIVATGKPPLNQERLLEALRLLQFDPVIESVSAELLAGTQPGRYLLAVTVKEKPSFSSEFRLNNDRSPSVGSFQRQLQLNQANLLGLGDILSVAYTNTDGSDSLDARYRIPVSPYYTTLTLNYGRTSSSVIEKPFNQLDIISKSRYYEAILRLSVIKIPKEDFNKEWAFGLAAVREESEASLLSVPFPLSAGADNRGRTRLSVLRGFSEFTWRDNKQSVFARGQLSLGINALNSTINASGPDSRFFAVQTHGEWLRFINGDPDNVLLMKGDLQLASRALVPLEQFSIGGRNSVRGYRQDALLTDNGIFASIEYQYPFKRIPTWQTVLQIIPFVDFGKGWNSASTTTTSFNNGINRDLLASAGVGLRWKQGENFTARLDWGIPIVDFPSRKGTWQENGLYFSVEYNPF